MSVSVQGCRKPHTTRAWQYGRAHLDLGRGTRSRCNQVPLVQLAARDVEAALRHDTAVARSLALAHTPGVSRRQGSESFRTRGALPLHSTPRHRAGSLRSAEEQGLYQGRRHSRRPPTRQHTSALDGGLPCPSWRRALGPLPKHATAPPSGHAAC